MTTKDSFVVSNQIVGLDVMNVWKEPLVSWDSGNECECTTPETKEQGDFHLPKKNCLGV